MSQGWIKLGRAIQEHYLWSEKPFTIGQAWIDLLLLAAFDDCKIQISKSLVFLKRGQILTTVRRLGQRWGWGHGRTQRFLDMLQSDNMIDTQTTHNGTIITIQNYEKYQKIPGETSGTQ